jgi:hypothetical protein
MKRIGNVSERITMRHKPSGTNAKILSDEEPFHRGVGRVVRRVTNEVLTALAENPILSAFGGPSYIAELERPQSSIRRGSPTDDGGSDPWKW